MAGQMDQALAGLAKAEECCKCAVDTIPDYVTDITELDDVGDMDSIREDYKKLMKSYIQMQLEIDAYTEAMQEMKTKVHDGACEVNAVQQMEDLCKEIQQTQPAVEQQPAYISLIRSLADKDDRSQDDDLGEEELMIQEETQTLKCPYTGKEMVEPVKNTNCGHSYDKEGIMAYVSKQKNRRAIARCPVSGCPNKLPISQKCLVPDINLKKQLKRKHQSQLRV